MLGNLPLLQMNGSGWGIHNLPYSRQKNTELIPSMHACWASQVALVVKNPPANAGDTGDLGSIPGLERCPRGEHGNLLQYSCLENPMDRGAWRAIVHRVAKSRTQLKRLSTHAHTHNLALTSPSFLFLINDDVNQNFLHCLLSPSVWYHLMMICTFMFQLPFLDW